MDLYCGSGNSGWPNPDKPGEGEYTCTNVRFVIDSVEAVDASLTTQVNVKTKAQLDEEANKQRLIAAQAIYGEDAGYWLALQDTLKMCQAPATCVVNIASPNGQSNTPPVVVVPSTTAPSGG